MEMWVKWQAGGSLVECTRPLPGLKASGVVKANLQRGTLVCPPRAPLSASLTVQPLPPTSIALGQHILPVGLQRFPGHNAPISGSLEEGTGRGT